VPSTGRDRRVRTVGRDGRDGIAQDDGVRTPWDSTWLRAAVLIALLVLGVLLALTVDLPSVGSVRRWLDGAGTIGWLGLVLGLAVVLLAPVPRSAMSVLVGVVAGFWLGLVVTLAGGMLSAIVAFGLSRVLGRPAATRLAGPRLERMDRRMSERSFVPVLVGRLIPVMPFVVLSYGAGLAGVRFVPYALATAVGLVPSSVVQVAVGASATAVLSRATAATVVPVVAVLVLVSLAGGWAWRRWQARTGGVAEPVG
jgi:uncharacterized membrane protein YdjX (TVP38/TMEM64 family)